MLSAFRLFAPDSSALWRLLLEFVVGAERPTPEESGGLRATVSDGFEEVDHMPTILLFKPLESLNH
jgi:hypothetical protein